MPSSELQWQIFNKIVSQKLSLNAIFLDLKFCKNSGFSLSEHCE
jgi:hypothetical protein